MSAASDPGVKDTARVFSAFAAGLRFDDLPASVIETGRMFMADYIAACHAGLRINGKFNAAIREIIGNMTGRPEASVFASPDKLSAEAAAYMNAVYAHGADMDDGNRKAMGHVAAHVMSAVFALAEAMGDRGWADVFTAIIVGYEVYNRLAAMAQPGLVHRGFHSTGTAGAVACAAACAKLMGLDGEGIYDAIAIAAFQASGQIIIAESGQACKPLNPANAARTGIVAAKLAAKGIEGPRRPLESTKGWLHAMTDEVHYEMLEGLGEAYTICESYMKPYPSCRHTHCGIEAAARVREAMAGMGRGVEDIERVELHIYENAIRIAGQIRVPENLDAAKFSIHYSLAVALATGGFTLDDIGRAPTDAIRELISKIELIPDASMENVQSGIRGARLCVTLQGGARLERTVLLPKGDPTNPFTWEDVRRKMEDCLSGPAYSAQGVVDAIRAIRFEEPFEGVCALMAR